MVHPVTKIERIVVRGTNWVGDAVMTVPALRQLRSVFPQAHITLAARAFTKGLFADADFLDELVVHEGQGLRSVARQVREWRKRNFDLAILFPNSLETAVVASLARVPLRFGYATEGRQSLLTHPLAVPEWRSSKHEVFYYLQIVAEMEWILKGEKSFLETQPDGSLTTSNARRAVARDFLRRHGLNEPNDRPLILLCPGSINSRAKRWPAERYAALADRFIDNLGARVVLIGTAAEMEVSNEVTTRMRSQPLVLTGHTELAELVGLLGLADLLITNDTGPAHIAAAMERPTLVIFGPTNPLTTRPFSPFAEIIREPPDCAPCMLRDCPIDHRCMTAISVDQVFERAVAVLFGKHEPGGCSHLDSVSANDLKFAGQAK